VLAATNLLMVGVMAVVPVALVHRCTSRAIVSVIVAAHVAALLGLAVLTVADTASVLGRSSRSTIGYRTPQEVITEAEPAIGAVPPDASVPTTCHRSSGVPVAWARLLAPCPRQRDRLRHRRRTFRASAAFGR